MNQRSILSFATINQWVFTGLLAMLLAFSYQQLAFAQTEAEVSPLDVNLTAFSVKEVETEDGIQERFVLAKEVFPEEIIEYRLTLTNVSDETLPAGVNANGPIPEGTFYIADSATPSSALSDLTFSFDNGKTFAEAPLFRTEKDSEDKEVEVEVTPAEYTTARWSINEPLAPGQVLIFTYRVEVK